MYGRRERNKLKHDRPSFSFPGWIRPRISSEKLLEPPEKITRIATARVDKDGPSMGKW